MYVTRRRGITFQEREEIDSRRTTTEANQPIELEKTDASLFFQNLDPEAESSHFSPPSSLSSPPSLSLSQEQNDLQDRPDVGPEASLQSVSSREREEGGRGGGRGTLKGVFSRRPSLRHPRLSLEKAFSSLFLLSRFFDRTTGSASPRPRRSRQCSSTPQRR